MENKHRSQKDPSKKKVWGTPVLKRIPVNDEEGLLEYCKGKPYDVKQLKEVIETKLRPCMLNKNK